MARTIPLIRAAALLPVVRWLETRNWPVERSLADADLDYWPNLAPEDPIPVLNGIRLLRNTARAGGPDTGHQIVTEASIGELAYIGRVAMGARTPREAVQRISAAMPFHSSHEDIDVTNGQGGFVIRESWRLDIDAESLHHVQVYVASLVQQLCRFTGLGSPVFQHVEMTAHPQFGVAHMEKCFGIPVTPAKDDALTIAVADTVANATFRVVAKDRLLRPKSMRIAPLAEDVTLAGSLRPTIAVMLYSGEPTVERVARAGGTTARTLQRRLAEEGTSLSDQMTIVRRRLAEELLLEQNASIADITERLGYSSQSALTRAVRRWTGKTPSWIRNQQSA